MKSFYRLSFFVFSWLIAAQLFGQSEPRQSFTMEQCIEYALKNSVNIQNAILDQEIANSKVKETVGIGLPQVNASVNATDNTKLPRFFSRYSIAQEFNPG